MNLMSPLRAALPLVGFQERIVKNMVDRLRGRSRPLLLRSPTGSGKTLMIGRALDDITARRDVLWFWFVPYVNLVSQTIRTLEDHCPSLRASELTHGRRFEHQGGDVLVACVKTVASSDQLREVYAPKSEGVPALWDLVTAARAGGLHIGLVIDEAHIGVSSETEFGKFCLALAPDNIIMATATPRDHKLMDFLAAAEYADYETFTVSREEVVEQGLNKRYIAAIVYETTEAWQSVGDFVKTALKQAWKQHLNIRRKLESNGIGLVPLMLVQVANGEKSVSEATEYLIRDCGVPMEAIQSYEGRDADPAALQRMAHDPTCEVLIFKEAAGTGFDAPRAFVLASTKAVSDVDFAAQFIGRIMRVARPLREFIERESEIDPDLETGYVYLANASAQSGFETAAHEMLRLRNRLEGAIEKLQERRLVNGATVYTNRETDQPSLLYNAPFMRRSEPVAIRSSSTVASTQQEIRFGEFGVAPNGNVKAVIASRLSPISPETLDASGLKKRLLEREFDVHMRRRDIPHVESFKTEKKPKVEDMRNVVRSVARHLEISETDIAKAASAVYRGPIATELVTNLETSTVLHTSSVDLVLDHQHLAADVQQFLARLPQSSNADALNLVRAVKDRINKSVGDWFDVVVPREFHSPEILERVSRDAVYVLLRASKISIAKIFNAEIAKRVAAVDAAPLPDAMIFPAEIALTPSRKNIFGVFPPTEAQMEELYARLVSGERRSLRSYTVVDEENKRFFVDAFDYAWQLNQSEELFARRLDKAGFVEWWTRNPSRKPYAAAVVRDDSDHSFYPDFIVCVRYWGEDDQSIRLIETKFDVLDAAAKANRHSIAYGQIVFLRTDHERQTFKIIEPDGSLGADVGSDLAHLLDALRATSS